MTRPRCSILAGAAAMTLLTGCHRDQKATGHGTVSGQILKGSVSDDMLPYDAVKSKAPLAPPAAAEPARTGGDAGADSADATAAAPPTAVDSADSSPAGSATHPLVPRNF